ncbi:MAG: hypothetical protein AXA67_10455 [Methylothermaceae bacteria B42]|nr:MAG: hypothetical protein AXA67_10455 [Methylothermaceae bacteria B42]HHJ38894.1 Na(+)-translocating NADH-quinone reductase subunit C [Methylothermaceae bacterium]
MRQIIKTLAVVLGVAIVCSFVVTSAAVLLEERQQQNRRLERIRNILAVAGIDDTAQNPFELYQKKIVSRLVDFKTTQEVDVTGLPDYLHPDTFDFDKAAKDPRYGESIPRDRIGLKYRPQVMPVYLVKNNGGFDKVILLIVGKGLWSTLYGYLALEQDLIHIAGITFYQQGETPGLGGEITSRRWQALWRGKRAFDDQGRVAIRVGQAGADSKEFHVDGLTGATLTTRGVDKLVRYWLGPEGYGPYLQRLRKSQEKDE